MLQLPRCGIAVVSVPHTSVQPLRARCAVGRTDLGRTVFQDSAYSDTFGAVICSIFGVCKCKCRGVCRAECFACTWRAVCAVYAISMPLRMFTQCLCVFVYELCV